ncbi:isochorismatase family protein [Massilia sp. BJB1822]|uniref:isochorismatase family protein n=1 Tax=Massilia sp. BJB1822 TaxID=2744470 RepID=UPI0015937BE0|nr:isochorismatase family protein [Massilia sp. BJB1822]NVE00064.1 isochorismatase family protein [Massilia sp. BJB1822]
MSIPRIEHYAMPAAGAWPANRTAWRPERARCALLIHDMQDYFLKFYAAGAAPLDELLAHIGTLRQRCRQLGIPVFYSRADAQTPAERGLVSDFWGKGMGSADAAIVAALAPEAGDIVIQKHRYNAFHRTDLLAQLRALGRDQLLICGVYAHIGCLATALDAFMHDIEAFMVADALGDFSQQDHVMALSYAARRCAAVFSSAEVLAALAPDAAS